MDAVKLIPQLFYDLISRVVPGAFCLLAVCSAASNSVGSILVDPFSEAAALKESAFFLGAILLAASYLIGQLLAPLSDFYEQKVVWPRIPDAFKITPEQIEDQENSAFIPVLRSFLADELSFGTADTETKEARLRKAVFVWYDWLRIWDPDAGARAAKIRAEYRMHGGLATASLLAIAVHILRVAWSLQPLDWMIVGSLSFVVMLTTWGLARTFRTFQWAVVNQYFVAKTGGKGSGRANLG